MREKLGASLVLLWHFGLERLVHFPPQGAHTGPEAAFLFQLVTLAKHDTAHKQMALCSSRGTFPCCVLQRRASHRLGGYFNLEKFSLPAQNRPGGMEASVAGPVHLPLQNTPEKKKKVKNTKSVSAGASVCQTTESHRHTGVGCLNLLDR